MKWIDAVVAIALVVMAVCTVVQTMRAPSMKVSEWREPDSPGAAEYQQRLVRIERAKQEQCLALNVYHEARGEPEAGKRAVAEVTLARVAERSTSICREVYRPAQFSWTATPTRAHGPAWRDAQRVAAAVLFDEMRGACCEHAKGATYYHANSVRPGWARTMERVATIGNHHFYRRARWTS